MYDKTKADIIEATVDARIALDKISFAVKSTEAILNNKTRLAVLEECHQRAKKRLADANYDLAQTKSSGQPYNFTPRDIVDMDNDIVHLNTLVTSARFAVKHEK